MSLLTAPLRAPAAALAALLLVTPSAPPVHEPVPSLAGAAAGSWVRPVQPGGVVHGFDPPAQAWLAGHRGVDLTASVGDVVRSPADGVVTFAGPVAGRGVLVVTHDDGLRTSLEPVDATVARGSRVSAGDPVATLSTDPGHCTPAACLHWGVRAGETYVDPLALLGRVRIVLLGRRGLRQGDAVRRSRRRREGRAGGPSPPCASARCATR
ncbi:peptidase M23-like protein [Flavimobilis soli]|uniref:Peptidase M23-like protein n=1 Tax=Flavimobilis soli TaxID=442709 RepID=A0A2A9EBN1_9MICO|nr:M23 family metallopeptidase [Flavimobilis soli]PFG35961.1 peptidase M23-like protein [Flavimobilis soli]